MKEYIIQIDDIGERAWDGSRKVFQTIELVRCKDCKHRPVKPEDYYDGFSLEFPDDKCPCQCMDGWYSWYPKDNWFCADGERAEEQA